MELSSFLASLQLLRLTKHVSVPGLFHLPIEISMDPSLSPFRFLLNCHFIMETISVFLPSSPKVKRTSSYSMALWLIIAIFFLIGVFNIWHCIIYLFEKACCQSSPPKYMLWEIRNFTYFAPWFILSVVGRFSTYWVFDKDLLNALWWSNTDGSIIAIRMLGGCFSWRRFW